MASYKKQKVIKRNNQRENKNRKEHTYRIGDKVLYDQVSGTVKSKYGQNPYIGPYTVLKVNDNGTLTLSKVTNNGGAVIQTWNVRNVDPCRD